MPECSLPKISSRREALDLVSLPAEELFSIADLARRVRSSVFVDICSIINARSGACPEDCAFCAQSARHRTSAPVYPLIDLRNVTGAAADAARLGARRFCVVTSGRQVSLQELPVLGSMVGAVADEGLRPCATLGMMSAEALGMLKAEGLDRYHHNLETSERFFPSICSTHTYRDKLGTIENARKTGLSVCSGGIFGMGETWDDRVDLALALRDLEVDSVPLNFLVPIAGTPLENQEPISPEDALRVIALFRLILPDREVRVCGGRVSALKERVDEIFRAGADGFLMGNYLTVAGREPTADRESMMRQGLEPRK